MALVARQAVRDDIPAMHRVRKAVRENKLSPNTKIHEETYVPYLETMGRGWVLEEDGIIVAFAIGEHQTGNIWAVFVHQDHEGKGYGRKVLEPMIAWLFSQGLDRIHLTTGATPRAQGFYTATGWTFTGIDSHGDAAFERLRPVVQELKKHGARRSNAASLSTTVEKSKASQLKTSSPKREALRGDQTAPV